MEGKKGREHLMKHSGLAPYSKLKDMMNEIVALVVLETNISARSNGVAAVPLDVNLSDDILIGACAVLQRGFSLAVLVTQRLTASVMKVSGAVTMCSGVFVSDGAARIAHLAVCVSFDLNGLSLSRCSHIYSTLSSLNLGRQSFNMGIQFHYFTLEGQLGDMGWERRVTAHQIQSPERCCELKDGSSL
ncbi:hypothetical protein FGB62_407g010 [Gracilaria domingensis]|nr:hypothetical protein FGB62_407g010 [Gracilaria domingensis]